MANIVKCIDSFTDPRELDGGAIRSGLSAGAKALRKFIVFASPGRDKLVVVGPSFDMETDAYPRFYYHKDIRAVAEELYGRKDIAGGGFAIFLCEEVDGVRQDSMLLTGQSSEFGAYPAALAGPDGIAALSAWYGAPADVA